MKQPLELRGPTEYVTVRYSVFVDPSDGGRAFASLSRSPEGATSWAAIDREGLAPLLQEPWPETLYRLAFPSQDSDHSQAREIGRQVFDVFLPGAVGEGLESVRKTLDGRRLRLAIDADSFSHSGSLVDIPWELLHDKNDFLHRSDCSIVRIERQLAPDLAYFGPLSRIGLISALPPQKHGVPFDQVEYLERLSETLEGLGAQAPFLPRATRRSLVKFLESADFDAIYFLGYGTEGKLLLHSGTDGKRRDWLEAGDLADMLSPSGSDRQVSLVYLNSCLSAAGEGQLAVAGVAQRLLMKGRVGSVVAMQAEIEVNTAQQIASDFLEWVVQVGDPEAALHRARLLHSDMWARSTPVLYTHIAGPEYFRRNRLARILGTEPQGTVGISLPSFRMGCKEEGLAELSNQAVIASLEKKEIYFYRGPTVAATGLLGTKTLLDLLGEVTALGNIDIRPDEDGEPEGETTFYFGSISNQYTPAMVEQYSEDFRLAFTTDEWTISDIKKGVSHTVPNPAKKHEGSTYVEREDWGILEKNVTRGRTRFFFAGLGDRATRGCPYFLSQNWESLLATFQGGPFALLLHFPPGVPYTHATLVDR